MTFDQAGRYLLPWGMYRGQSIGDVAATDEGLYYLYGLAEFGTDDLPYSLPKGLALALECYLHDAAIDRTVCPLAA